jgi:hypothetical protein
MSPLDGRRRGRRYGINFSTSPVRSRLRLVDTNRDQVRQLNETGIGGVTITMTSGGTPVTVTTASDGGYSPDPTPTTTTCAPSWPPAK